MKTIVITVGILLTVVVSPLAAENRKVSPVEGYIYLTRAEEELSCNPARAEQLLDRARASLQSSLPDSDVADATRARMTRLDGEIQSRKKSIRTHASQIQSALKKRRPDEALTLAQRALTEASRCDLRFQKWQALAKDRIRSRDLFLKEGNELLNRAPKAARRFFEQARKISPDHPEIPVLIEKAEALRRNPSLWSPTTSSRRP